MTEDNKPTNYLKGRLVADEHIENVEANKLAILKERLDALDKEEPRVMGMRQATPEELAERKQPTTLGMFMRKGHNPHFATIGHVDHSKTTLSAAIAKTLEERANKQHLIINPTEDVPMNKNYQQAVAMMAGLLSTENLKPPRVDTYTIYVPAPVSVPKAEVLPRGTQRYYFNGLGAILPEAEHHLACFNCIAINEGNAIRKFMRFYRASTKQL